MGSCPRDRGPGEQYLGFFSGGELSPVGSCPRTALLDGFPHTELKIAGIH